MSEQEIEKEKKSEKGSIETKVYNKRGYKIPELWECECREQFKTNSAFKNHVKTGFSYKRPPANGYLLKEIRHGSFFGYVQCDLIVFDVLKTTFSNFFLNLKKKVASAETILEKILKDYAQDFDLLNSSKFL